MFGEKKYWVGWNNGFDDGYGAGIEEAVAYLKQKGFFHAAAQIADGKVNNDI